MKFHSHLNTAIALLKAYDGKIPFSAYIKNHFRENKKFARLPNMQNNLCVKQLPDWVLKGNVIPISFEGVPPIEGALICPRCSSANLSLDNDVLKTVPDRIVNGLRIGFMCHECEMSKSARNCAQILNVTTQDGKCYCKWEK